MTCEVQWGAISENTGTEGRLSLLFLREGRWGNGAHRRLAYKRILTSIPVSWLRERGQPTRRSHYLIGPVTG